VYGQHAQNKFFYFMVKTMMLANCVSVIKPYELGEYLDFEQEVFPSYMMMPESF
jgi:hypothetical protein